METVFAARGIAAELDAEVTALVIGSGVQGRTQLEAVNCVRPIQSVRVYDTNAASAGQFADEMQRHLGVGITRGVSNPGWVDAKPGIGVRAIAQVRRGKG